MTFAEVLTYLKSIPSKDVIQLINELESGLIYLADQWKFAATILFSAGLVLALIIGLAAFKLVKPTMILLSGFFGIMAGSALFYELWPKMPKMPDWTCYLFCLAVAALLICVTAVKPAAALAFYAGALGYLVVSFYFSDTVFAFAGALLLSVIAYILPRTFYIIVTSLMGGLLTVGFLAMLLPKVKELQLDSGWTSVALVLAIALAYIIIQAGANRYQGEEV